MRDLFTGSRIVSDANRCRSISRIAAAPIAVAIVTGLFLAPRAFAQSQEPNSNAQSAGPIAKVGSYDGEYVSLDYNYAFQVVGNQGICTQSNSPKYAVGSVMFTFTADSAGKFTGSQIYTDGNWYPVRGSFSNGAIEIFGPAHHWFMTSKISPEDQQVSDPPVSPPIQQPTVIIISTADLPRDSSGAVVLLPYKSVKSTLELSYKGKSISLVSNSNSNGLKEGDPTPSLIYQCVELINRYVDELTGSTGTSGLGDGKDVAAALPTISGGLFSYHANGASTAPPQLGSVVSVNIAGKNEEFGHVGIVQAISPSTPNASIYEVTLFDQNWPSNTTGAWKTVIFNRDSSGNWKGILTSDGSPNDVVGWANLVP